MAWGILYETSERQDRPELNAHTMFAKAAKVLESHILQNGKAFAKAAYDQPGGRIPKHLRPVYRKDHNEHKKMQLENASILQHAGSSVAFSRDVTTLYHPNLTFENLRAADLAMKSVELSVRSIVLLEYMIDDSVVRESDKVQQVAKIWKDAMANHLEC